MEYKDKVISIEKALSFVKSDSHIFTGLGAGEAQLFMDSLPTISDKVRNVTITNCLPLGKGEYLKREYRHAFKCDGWFYSPPLRKGHPNGNVSFIPNHLHFAGPRRLLHIPHPDIFVGVCSTPDKHGYVSLSVSNTYEKRVMEAAKLVILEVNPNYPRTFGDCEVHVNDVDYFVEVDYQVPLLPEGDFTEKDKIIGDLIAEKVQDGDCIQIGIGGIPNAVCSALYGKKHLGIHTELLTTGMMKLMKAGVVDNSRKTLHKGRAVTTMIMGTRELYEFVDDNPAISLMDGAYVNDPYVIAKNDNQVSINTAMEVDLTGQVCSESIGSLQFSGAGGQADTAIGAQMSKGGRSFIALYSTAMVRNPVTGEKEEVSKIVAQLKPGAIVTLQRQDVQYIVTEYGIADLYGKSVKERVEALIAIAHPKFREQLYKEALECKIIGNIHDED